MNRGLTSFRAMAFLAVFFFHFEEKLFPIGYLGVQAFFVLSGFLLTPILVKMKEDLPAQKFFVSFYGRRILRIFPLYYLYLVAVLLLSLLIVSVNKHPGSPEVDRFLEQVPWAFTYAYNFFCATVFYQHTPLLSHFWSLAVEEQFYLIWPVLILLVKPKHLKVFLAATIFLSPVFRFLSALITTGSPLAPWMQSVDLVLYMLPFSHFDAFAIGGFFALYQGSGSKKLNFRIFILAYCTILLGYFTQYVTTGYVSLPTLGYAPFLRHDQYVWGYSLINLVFASTLIQIKGGYFFSKVFDNPFLHYLGKISYGLYVFHYPLILLIKTTIPDLPFGIKMLTALLATIIISALSYELFERRFIEMKDKFFNKTAHVIPPPHGEVTFS